MNTRLSQDAADSLAAYEFQQAERERWARAQPPKIVGMWKFELAEAERQEREELIAVGTLPF